MSSEETTTVKVPAPIVQIIITMFLAAISAYVGVVSGNAVTRAQMVEFDRRLTQVERKVDAFADQQIEMYRTQVAILQRQLEADSAAKTK